MREWFVTGRLQRRHHLSITLVFTRSILDLTLPVTELLQGKEIDMADRSHLQMASKVRIIMKLNLVKLHSKKS